MWKLECYILEVWQSWLIALLLKSSDPNRVRGFESLSFREINASVAQWSTALHL